MSLLALYPAGAGGSPRSIFFQSMMELTNSVRVSRVLANADVKFDGVVESETEGNSDVEVGGVEGENDDEVEGMEGVKEELREAEVEAGVLPWRGVVGKYRLDGEIIGSIDIPSYGLPGLGISSFHKLFSVFACHATPGA
jgi:hypothetical protein